MDEIQEYLINQIKMQEFTRKHINKPITTVDKINTLSISGVKQRLNNIK